MTTPTIPFYPVTHDDGINIVAAINDITRNLETPSLIADEFSTSKDYAIDDLVIYQGVLYRFIEAHSAGAWNSNHVTACSIAQVLKTFENIRTGRFQIPANQTTTINVKKNTRSVLWIIGGLPGAMDMMTISATSGGTISYMSYGNPSGLSYAVETGKLKITNTTSANMFGAFIDFNGQDLAV